MEKKFYVYTHHRATDGSVFYVGKGHGKRAWSKSRSNPHWQNIVKKNGYYVKIVARFHNEQCAFSFERAMISFYGRESLCNLTDGGEGVCGYVFPDDVIDRLRPFRKMNKMSDENKEILRDRWRGAGNPNANGLRPSQIEAVKSANIGKKASAETKAKMSSKRKGHLNPATKKELHWFVHDEHGIYLSTELSLRRLFNVDRGRLSLMTRGLKEKVNGWSMLR